jgi:hypothetical protein
VQSFCPNAFPVFHQCPQLSVLGVRNSSVALFTTVEKLYVPTSKQDSTPGGTCESFSPQSFLQCATSTYCSLAGGKYGSCSHEFHMPENGLGKQHGKWYYYS